MKEIMIPAHGKINLTLDITGKRLDGYHELESLMQQVALYDEVVITLTGSSGITVSSDSPEVPGNTENIAYRAAHEITQLSNKNTGINIFIRKRIPVAGGMAGGSSNAAAVLVGLNKLLGLNFAKEQLMEIGVRLGADIPFCIQGGAAIARGIGEILTPMAPPPSMWMVLVKPDFGVSTAQVYSNFRFEGVVGRPDLSVVLDGIERGSLLDIYQGMGNVLESVTMELYPLLKEIKADLALWGADHVLMSGSGPTICAFTETSEQAKTLRDKAVNRFPPNYQIVVTQTISHGEGGKI